jgi:hypothetical protein
MDRVLTLLCALILAAGGALAWDRHPPIRIPVGPFHFDLPKSLAQERDDAIEERDSAKVNVHVLTRALETQNASVAALKRDSDARVAESVKAVLAASRASDGYRAQAARVLSAKPQSDDRCAEADRLILGTIR